MNTAEYNATTIYNLFPLTVFIRMACLEINLLNVHLKLYALDEVSESFGSVNPVYQIEYPWTIVGKLGHLNSFYNN